MAPEEERRGRPESGKGDFEGRDLLVGRPEGGEGQADCRRRRNPAGDNLSAAQYARRRHP